MGNAPRPVRLLAIFVTGTAMLMAGVAALDRGGNGLDRSLLVAHSVSVVAAVHLLPAISRRPVALLLWAGCFMGAVYGHLVFFTHASIRVGEVFAHSSAEVSGTTQQITGVREALSAIAARPVAVVAQDIAEATNYRQKAALRLELAEAKRAAVLRDHLVLLEGQETRAAVRASVDPVVGRIAAILGSTENSIGLVIGLYFATLLELVGAFLWCEALRLPIALAVQEQITIDPLADLKAAIADGRCKPTVTGIRTFLGCSQTKALELRRALG